MELGERAKGWSERRLHGTCYALRLAELQQADGQSGAREEREKSCLARTRTTWKRTVSRAKVRWMERTKCAAAEQSHSLLRLSSHCSALHEASALDWATTAAVGQQQQTGDRTDHRRTARAEGESGEALSGEWAAVDDANKSFMSSSKSERKEDGAAAVSAGDEACQLDRDMASSE